MGSTDAKQALVDGRCRLDVQLVVGLVDRWVEPQCHVSACAAGLHVTVQLPEGVNEQAIREESHNRRIELETMADYRSDSRGRPPILLLGYAQMTESAIRAGVHELADAVRAASGSR